MISNFNLRPGTFLQNGRYQIERFISSGGFGCTYEAIHVSLNKRVAIKELYVSNLCNRDEATSQVSVGATSQRALFDKLKKKFMDEARAICSLNHPGIVKVIDIFHENGTAYYVMEYIDGQSLGQMIRRGPLTESQAKDYVIQVADALRYVHAHNRLHLDVKPDNILVDKSNKAILIDFGVSKLYDDADGENASTLMGMSPGYAPPEQMDRSVTHFAPSADIYSLGATYYKLLTGITPPSATRLISGEDLPPLPDHVSLSSLIAISHALRFNKSQRPQTIDDFLTLLSGKSQEKTISSGAGYPPYPPQDTTVRMDAEDSTVRVTPDNVTTPRRTQTGLYVLIGVLAVLLVGAVFLLSGRSCGSSATGYAHDSLAYDSLDGLAVVDTVDVVEIEEMPDTAKVVVEESHEPTEDEINAFVLKLKNNIKVGDWTDMGWKDSENYGDCSLTLTNKNDVTIDGSDYHLAFKYEYLYAEGMYSENCTKKGKTMSPGGHAEFTHHYTDDCGPLKARVVFDISNRALYDKYHR